MIHSAAEILREYGPFPDVDHVHGVTFDRRHVWFASGEKLNAFDLASGKAVRSIDVAGDAGTAFDGQHFFQLAEGRIQKIDPKTGRALATVPAPGGGGGDSARLGRRDALGGAAPTAMQFGNGRNPLRSALGCARRHSGNPSRRAWRARSCRHRLRDVGPVVGASGCPSRGS
jgi:hypothetical protein